MNGLAGGVHRFVRGKFTADEDALLQYYVYQYGAFWHWDIIAKYMPWRNARQLRERYDSYVCLLMKKGPWTPEEDLLLRDRFEEYGSRWTFLQRTFFPHRSVANVRNHWTSLCVQDRRQQRKDANDTKDQKSPIDPMDWAAIIARDE
jgi:hypothetical protein